MNNKNQLNNENHAFYLNKLLFESKPVFLIHISNRESVITESRTDKLIEVLNEILKKNHPFGVNEEIINAAKEYREVGSLALPYFNKNGVVRYEYGAGKFTFELSTSEIQGEISNHNAQATIAYERYRQAIINQTAELPPSND